MKILIAGGAGFIGSNLAEYLLKKGHEVTVVDSLITGRLENIKPFLDTANFQFFHCAIESDEFKKLFIDSQSSFDRIYDLACPTGVPNIEKLGDEMLAACSAGTMNVLNLVARTGAKFLFTSSSEVYGQPEVFPQSESYAGNVNTLGPRANYEEGKRFSETLIQRFVKTRGIQGKIVRLFNVYGPNMSLEDTRVIPRFATQALLNKPLTVQGDGSQRRTFCYVSEIVNGLELVMEKGVAGKAYNLGSDKEMTILDLAELIIKSIGSASEIIQVERPKHDHNSRLPALSEIIALGWENRVALQDGLRLSMEYFRANVGEDKYSQEISAKIYQRPYTNLGKA
jgi:nucleoside-diphosphate-sugar epimerase